jgi:hypothetical protein
MATKPKPKPGSSSSASGAPPADGATYSSTLLVPNSTLELVTIASRSTSETPAAWSARVLHGAATEVIDRAMGGSTPRTGGGGGGGGKVAAGDPSKTGGSHSKASGGGRARSGTKSRPAEAPA